MSVIITNTGLNHVLNGMLGRWDIGQYSTAKILPSVNEDARELDLCCYEQLVLADATGIENQNDKSGFMFQMASSSDTLEIYLYKGIIQKAQINNNTYGIYYAVGSIAYYSDQSLLTGCIIDWAKVRTAFGVGKYTIQFVHTTLGTPTTYETGVFDLKTFSFEVSNGTIRIESYTATRWP